MIEINPEVLAAAKAIGLFDGGGNLSTAWFEHPLAAVEMMLTSPNQREALLDLFDQLFEPETPPGVAANEKWHPLLGNQPNGNLYLTVANHTNPLTLGIGGEIHSTTSPLPASLRCHLPIVSATGSTVTAVAGTDDGPFKIDLRVELNWSKATGQSIGLRAIRASAQLTPLSTPPASLHLVLEGLSLDGGTPKDTELDPRNLEGEALPLVISLVREQLHQLASSTGEAAAVVQHLMPALGLADGFPPFPFTAVVNDPSAFRNWLAAIATAGKFAEWFGHVGALIGGSAALEGSGTRDDPWRLRIFQIDANSKLELTLARVTAEHSGTPALEIGLRATYLPAGTDPIGRIQAVATFVSIPLQGLDTTAVLPLAAITMVAPGDAASSLVDSAAITVRALEAGGKWNGSEVVPLLQLDDVTFTFAGKTTHYPRIDLTHADSVVEAASDAVLNAIRLVLGTTGTGHSLAVLAGIDRPASDPAWPHLVNVGQLVSNPANAIAAVHRAALLDATHSWAFLFAEIASMLGVVGPVNGAGTFEDPWRVRLESDTISIELSAWNAQQSTNSTDPQQLRVGLRLSAASAPWSMSWLAELLALDLTQNGGPKIALLGGQHAQFLAQPIPTVPETAGIAIGADSVAVKLDWSPGGPLQMRAVVSNISVASGTTVNIPSLMFPPPAGFNLSNPLPTLGVDADALRTLVRALLARGSYSWAGTPGLTLSTLFGLNGNLPGLQPDWPTLGGDFLSDPFGSLHAWLGSLVTSVSANGSPFLPNALAWLQAFLNDSRTELDAPAPDAVVGSGTYDDPWAIEVADDLDLLMWLEPDGPPSNWAAPLPSLISSLETFDELILWAATFGSLVPTAQESLSKQDVVLLIGALNALESWFLTTDGFVPTESQIPTGGTWTSGAAIHSAHNRQPADPSAIGQIQSQIATLNPSDKVVLLIGPAFSDHTIWTDLLGSVALKPNFNLRLSGVDPSLIDLRGVTDAADFYTADLAENGLQGVTAQIARAVDRINELRPGIPVTLVAHSTAGLAARAYTAANPAKVRGLITLGTPHLGTSLFPLRDASAGSAVRTINELTPTLPAGPIRDVLEALTVAMDGVLPSSGPGQLPVPQAFPLDAFNPGAGGTIDTAGVPAVAIGGAIDVSLFTQVKQALADLATASAGAAKPAPTHLAFGARTRVDMGTSGEIQPEVFIRCDAARLPLSPGVPEPTRPVRALGIEVAFTRPGAWVAGSAFSNVRLRWAQFGLSITPTSVVPSLRLHGAAFESPALGLIDETHAQALSVLGAMFHSFGDLGSTSGPALTAVIGALEALGITTNDPHGGSGISADAWKALTTDARSYLTPRLASALSAGLAGFSATTGSPGVFTRAIGDTPFQTYIDGDSIGVRSPSLFAFSSLAGIEIDARVSLRSFTPSLDLTFNAGALSVEYVQNTGRLTLHASPWIEPLTLIPLPTSSELASALNHAIPRVLLSAAASALIEATVGVDVNVGPLTVLFDDPAAALISALGDGKALDAARINAFLKTIADVAGMPDGEGLPLPASLQLVASGADPVELAIVTMSPVGGIVDLQLAARIDRTLHVTPAGSVIANLSLPGTWPTIAITFGVDASGVSLVLAPQTDPPTPPIQLLPTFSGLGALLGAAEALLPSALDALVDAVGPSTLRDDALSLAQAFDLYDSAGKFTAHSAQLRALTQGHWAAAVSSAMQTTAIPALRNVLAHVAGTVNVSANAVTIGVGSEFNVALGWDTGPTIALHTSALKAADGALTSDIDLGFVLGQLTADVVLGLHLQSSIGVSVIPALKIAYATTGLSVKILPLGAANESTLAINVAPSPGIQAAGDVAGALAREWLLPVASSLLISAARPHFGLNVWTGGPTVQKLLNDAGLITATGDLASPLPGINVLLLNTVKAFADSPEIAIADFKLKFVSDATGLGASLRGFQKLSLSGVELKVRLENTALPTANPGVTVYIFRDSSGLQFSPKLSVAGLGVELSGPGGLPLVNNSAFRLQSAGGSLFFDFDGSVANLGAAVDAKGFGLPLSLLGGSHDGGNPVASSLLEGKQTNSGDPEPVNPSVDVQVSYVGGTLGVQLGAPAPPVWIGLHRSFGPIYIEQIGLRWTNDDANLLVDGSVKVAALIVQAYELGLKIPFRQLLAPEHWSLDLQGLAVGFQSGPVSVAGGLIKNPGPPIEYDGILSADLAGRGFTMVGSYARPTDNFGNFTSLFLFVSLPTTIGGPPYLFITGLGGGAAYNRALTPPTNLNQIPTFFLVSAIDDSSLANDPMAALVSMGRFVPPRRGGYWLAAGIRFNSFVVVNSVAVVYVALDRGFEVGVLGVSRLQLPPEGDELVNIELALKARYSTAEDILSIQAQLTNNSWLFSEDCQLTGGFAFFIWFAQGHFVLTIGGYHPSFQKPPEFPDIPRLGFHWQVFDGVQIKGEAYFAVTSSAFMCGGRLEASASLHGVRAWFTVHLDVLIQWDPFHYDFLGGIEVGVRVRIEVCFFGACAHITITISRGADIHVFGPPFHVDVTFDAYITSITLSFGGDPHPIPDALPFPQFRDKYLIAGNPENSWVSARVISGLIPVEPPGSQPLPGTQAEPWKLSSEFAFITESRMPASGYSVMATALDPQGAVIFVTLKSKADSKSYDIAPMQKLGVGSVHSVMFSPALTHPDQFIVEEIFDLLPEATWRWYDPAHLPAAANRINAITGLRITAIAALQGKSALIPISTLVDDDPRFARPLPFASILTHVGVLQTAGFAAEALAVLGSVTGSDRTISAAKTVVAGAGFFEEARVSVGLPARGIPPVAARALERDRSSPPLLTPLATGLSMRPVGLDSPPRFVRPDPIAPVNLDQVRLKAVLQARVPAVVDAPPAARTTVTKVSIPNAPRMQAPRPKVVAGAKLHTVAARNSEAPTTISAAARTLRSPQVAALSGRVHAENFEAATQAIMSQGVDIPAGATHVWELPDESFELEALGHDVVRMVFLDRAGNPLLDFEAIVNLRLAAIPPPGSQMVAVACLGSSPADATQITPAFGAVTSVIAPPRAIAAVGWQVGNLLPQVGPAALLARGAVLILRKPNVSIHNNQRTTQAMTPVSAALVEQSGAETWLPKSIGVVMIILDRQDPTAAEAGDLAIACKGATLALPPVVGAGGNRTALLYDVVSTDADARYIKVAVGSKTGWALSGVVGLPGRAIEWAAQLHGTVPPHLVPDGPLTAGGEVRIRRAHIYGGARD